MPFKETKCMLCSSSKVKCRSSAKRCRGEFLTLFGLFPYYFQRYSSQLQEANPELEKFITQRRRGTSCQIEDTILLAEVADALTDAESHDVTTPAKM